MTEKKQEHERILERNVAELLTRAHEPPRIADEARERILASLTARVREQAAPAKAEGARVRPRLGRRPLWAGGLALAATAAAALIAVPLLGGGDHTVHANADPAPRRVALDDGSELILDTGAEVEILGDRHVRLRRGLALFDIAPADQRFRVDTAHGRIQVLGTRFTASADDAETRAAVARGRVEIANQQGSEQLAAGEEGLLRDGAAPVRRRAPRLSHLASFAESARRGEERADDPAPVRKGTLLARNPIWQEQEFPLPMRELTVDLHVEDQVARVALDQTFFNPREQQLEGVYRLTLPPGAAISRQAMYVDGVLRESAIVEREQARRIYEEIVYTMRDPALLEWMAGNLFQVRIFPLPARTEKRIVFEYTQNLPRLYDDTRIEVPLPETDSPVRSLKVRARLVGCAQCTITSTSHAITTAIDGGDALVTYDRERWDSGGSLLLTIRRPQPAARVAAARDGERQYWMARLQPRLDGAAVTPGPRRWVILHDTSASRAALDLKAQAHVIDRLLDELDETDEVALVAFDTTLRTMPAPAGATGPFVRVDDIDRREAARFLARESRDGVGSTDLAAALDSALALLQRAPAGPAPHILYLGDGIAPGPANGIETLRRRLAGRATFVGVAVGARMDLVKLGALAAATGGYVAAMSPGEDLTWRTFDLVAALNTPRVVELDAELLDAAGRPLAGADLYPSSRQLAEGEELALVARLDGAAPASVRISGTAGGVAWSQTLALPAPAATQAGYLPRLWAQRRIEALLAGDVDGGRREIIELGTRHFLMTPYTSLLVLENDAMVRQYGVKQGDGRGWAGYRLPARIPVVHEPTGTTSGGTVALDAVLVRTPTQLFHSYGTGHGYGRGEGGEAEESGGFDGGGRMSFAGFLGGDVPLPAGGGGTGDERNADASKLESPRPDLSDEVDLLVEKEIQAQTAAQPSASEAKLAVVSTPVSGTITTSELAGADDDWTVVSGKKAKGGGGYRELDGHWASNGLIGGLEHRGRRSARADRSLGWTRGPVYGGGGELYPVAYHWSGDPRLDDLTEMVPALYTTGLDVERDDLLRALAGRRGSITDEARTVVDAARAGLPARLRSGDGAVIDLGADGGLRITRVLDSGLAEEIVFDGRWLEHRYAELGLAVRRAADGGAAQLWARFAPFALPPADALAAVYQVSLAGPRIVRLALPGDSSGRAVDLVVDDASGLVEIRAVDKAKATTLLRIEHDASGPIVVDGDQRIRYRREAPAAGAPAPALTVIEMPLRQPGHWFEQARVTTPGSDAWRRVQVQLLASWAAMGNAGALAEVALALRGYAPLTRGELALASRGIAGADVVRARALLVGADAADPVVAYLEASRRHRLPGAGAATAFDQVAARAPGSLIGLLASYRGAITGRAYTPAGRRETARRIRELTAAYRQPALLYLAAHQFGASHGWRAPEESAAVWDAVAAAAVDGAWRRRAELAAVRQLYQAGKREEAGERALRLVSVGGLRTIEPILPAAIRQSLQGEVGWRLVWNRYRAEAMRRGDIESLLGLLGTAQMVGEHRDVQRVAARLAALRPADADQLAMVVTALEQAGRADEAAGLIDANPRLVDGDQPLMLRASVIAERRGRIDDAIRWLERTRAAYAGEPVALSEVRTDSVRLIGLYGRRAQASAGATRAAAADAVLEIAAAWRRLDPDNPAIDTAAAEVLHTLGRAEEAGRYLSTTIERHPLEGDSFRVVAEAFEREGEIERALPLWARAAEVEPTNPTWMLRHSQALAVVGRRAEATALLDRIVAGSWHTRFAGVVDQARRLRR